MSYGNMTFLALGMIRIIVEISLSCDLLPINLNGLMAIGKAFLSFLMTVTSNTA
jgi:hypothetical protein